MSGTIRIIDMPDLGTVYDTSSVVGEQAGSGRFGMSAVKTYMGATFATQAALDAETAARVANQFAVSVKSHGAVGDGVANDTAAFNAATAAATAQGGGVVMVPVGAYRINPITVPNYVALGGAVPGPPDPTADPTAVINYPTLLVNSTGTAFVTLGHGASLQDVLIHYPQQAPPSASAPNVYPAAIVMTATSVMRRCTITNAYNGIVVSGGRAIIEDCKIGAFNEALSIDGAADYTYVNNITIEPFWDTTLGLSAGQPIDAWVLANGIGIQVARGDAVILTGIRIFYRHTGIQLVDGTTGNSYGIMTDLDLTLVSYGVTAQSTNNNVYGWRIMSMNVSSSASVGQSANAAISLVTGGNSPPTVTWIGGCITGTWFDTPGYQFSAGSLNIGSVRGINGSGLLVAPGIPVTGGTMVNPYPYRCGVYPTGFSQVSLGGNQTGAAAPSYMEVIPGQQIGVTYTGTPSWVWFGL